MLSKCNITYAVCCLHSIAGKMIINLNLMGVSVFVLSLSLLHYHTDNHTSSFKLLNDSIMQCQFGSSVAVLLYHEPKTKLTYLAYFLPGVHRTRLYISLEQIVTFPHQMPVRRTGRRRKIGRSIVL